jgi:hypothetical protein
MRKAVNDYLNFDNEATGTLLIKELRNQTAHLHLHAISTHTRPHEEERFRAETWKWD